MISSCVRALVSTFRTHRDLALENLALRQQLAVLLGSVKRPALSNLDRSFWVLLSRIWKEWKRALVLVKRLTGDSGSLAPLRFQTLLDPGRTAPEANAERIPRLLPFLPDALVASEGCTRFDSRAVEPSEMGKVITIPKVGGLHHR